MNALRDTVLRCCDGAALRSIASSLDLFRSKVRETQPDTDADGVIFTTDEVDLMHREIQAHVTYLDRCRRHQLN